jgi:hypothetical protein
MFLHGSPLTSNRPTRPLWGPLRNLLPRAVLLLCLAAWAPVQAHKAHVHGQARLDVVLEDRAMTLELEIPQDSLLGFERPPRTPAERQQAHAALARLRETGLLQANPQARCVQRSLDIQAPALRQNADATSPDGHADVTARWVFECEQPALLRTLEVGLFAAFERLQRVHVQAVLPAGQRKAVLVRSAAVLRLAP